MIWVKRATRILYTALIAAVCFGALRSPSLDFTALPDVAKLACLGLLLLALLITLTPPLQKLLVRALAWLTGCVQRHIKACSVAFMLCIIAYQVVLVVFDRAEYGFDAGTIYNMVAMEPTGDAFISEYLSMYPNNQLIFLIMHMISKFSGGPHIFVWDLFNLLCIDITIIMTALAAGLGYSRAHGYATLLVGGLLLGFNPIVLVVYTDTVVLPFVSGGLLLLAWHKADHPLYMQLLCGLGLGCSVVLSYLMKPSALVPFIAVGMVLGLKGFISLWQRRSGQESAESQPAPQRLADKAAFKACSLLICVLLAFATIYYAFGWAVDKQSTFVYRQEESFPATHFIMMGLSEPVGSYSLDDVQATAAAGSRAEKVAYNLSVIRQRLGDFGLAGYLSFLTRKFTYNTADGTFTFRTEGIKPTSEDLTPEGWIAGRLASLYFRDGSNFPVFRFYSQLVWIAMALLMLCSWRADDDLTSILRLAMIGALVYPLLFEGGRSRYLVQFMPVICLLAASGLVALRQARQARTATPYSGSSVS